eukprot:12284728-Prorocentrum_lima.AAC.1
MTGTSTNLLTLPAPASLDQAPIEGSVLGDDGGTTLTSPKKNNCCWFGSGFGVLQKQHQGRVVAWT